MCVEGVSGLFVAVGGGLGGQRGPCSGLGWVGAVNDKEEEEIGSAGTQSCKVNQAKRGTMSRDSLGWIRFALFLCV